MAVNHLRKHRGSIPLSPNTELGASMNFKELCELYKIDPEAFENKRKEMIEDVIKSAPAHMQLKLRLTQAKWDRRMRGAGSAENRLVFAKSILMDQFINEFNPMMQSWAKELKDLTKQ